MTVKWKNYACEEESLTSYGVVHVPIYGAFKNIIVLVSNL